MPSATTTNNASSSSSSSRPIPPPVPRDARLVALILASMGIEDCEPAVLIQLLEFAHKYTHDVLSDALVYADHASSRQGTTQVSLEDVQLAVQSRVNYSFTSPPPKEMLLSLADSLNRVPLPPISEGVSLRLPPSNQCLTNVNFSIIPDELPQRRNKNEAHNKELNRSQNEEEVDNSHQRDERIGQEDDDYDEDRITEDPPQQGQSNSNPTASTAEPSSNTHPEQRGVKRSLEEDEDYD